MTNFLTKFKIPTLLGLGIIISGIATGVFLTFKNQGIISQASPDISAQDITISNLSDSSVTISWQTSIPTPSFITLGTQNPNEITVLDERDKESTGPKSHVLHYVTIKNLLPKTTYQYKIISGNKSSEIFSFTTTTPLNSQSKIGPVIGSAVSDNKPLEEGIAFLSITDATTQSALVKSGGHFLIPISQIRTTNLTENFNIIEDSVAKLTIIAPNGQASVLFKPLEFDNGLPPISIGDNLDLTIETEDPTKYDLNGDGRINSADSSIILQNKGPVSSSTKSPKADINQDGFIDQKDMDRLIRQFSIQN